jgi:triacylglycerol lipase
LKAKPLKMGFWLVAGLLLGSGPGFAQEAPGVPGENANPERRPVLLIPGWLGRSLDMIALKERLVRDGWEEENVFPLEFVDPAGSSVDHATELDQALQFVLRETGAREVDIVAHSMGGLAVWVLLQEKGTLLPINRVVFLATPFHGTVTAYLAWGEGGPEMIPESDFLRGLQRGGWPQSWVNVLTIRTPLDLTVVPGYGATLLGIGDRVICCPTHQGLLDHEETYLMVRDFLLFGRRRGGDPYSPNEPK